jgi:formamidopyrimidine-DNA glycosylase
MPEAPDLEVIKEILIRQILGRDVAEVRVVRPTVLRSLASQDFSSHLIGRTVSNVARRGKFLLLTLSGDTVLAINPMLTGTIQLCKPSDRLYKRTCLVLALGDDLELRYLDDRQMGKLYYVETDRLDLVPGLNDQGPDALSDDISFPEFKDRLRPYRGEIKGILTRGSFIAGIGNAYSDEILFAAGISPFRKRTALSEQELERLHRSSRQVLSDATEVLLKRMGEETHLKIRDFLKVHNKGNQPCPRCGSTISQLTANQRITSFCRQCQPGMLIRN